MTAPDQPAAITVSGDKATAPDHEPICGPSCTPDCGMGHCYLTDGTYIDPEDDHKPNDQAGEPAANQLLAAPKSPADDLRDRIRDAIAAEHHRRAQARIETSAAATTGGSAHEHPLHRRVGRLARRVRCPRRCGPRPQTARRHAVRACVEVVPVDDPRPTPLVWLTRVPLLIGGVWLTGHLGMGWWTL